jgi:hypothetical protein
MATQTRSVVQTSNSTSPEVPYALIMLVIERVNPNNALASGAGYLGVHRVTLSGVPLMAIQPTPEPTAYNVSDHPLGHPSRLTPWKNQDVC